MALKEVFENSFETYAGMTILDRAICDARDCLKPGARMAMYAQYIEKITPDKPYKKAQKSVATAMDHFYIHGDMSLYALLARMGKPFAMRYMLEDFQGNSGTREKHDNEAAPRYTEMRLSPISMNLFNTINKNTIESWIENYSGEEYYPAVLPSVGFYNIVNGTSGIATAIAASIPQFNLKEVNEAMIKLLWDPDIDFDEIYCAPDFCTGSILMNGNEVKESLRKGTGAACKLRSKVEYDSAEHCFIVTEVPYSVYTNVIRSQLSDIYNSEDNPGIEKVLDQSGTTSIIRIYINKKANPDRVLKYLYKNTSIQYHYPINMIMLDKGKVPKVFGWREALIAHIEHEKEVYTKSYKFDLEKIKHRLLILEGLLLALDHIDEVIKIIKQSASSVLAGQELIKTFGFTQEQTKYILDMKLSRLAKLESQKIKDEYTELEKEKERIITILNDDKLFKTEIEKGMRAVSNVYGDERRTIITNIEKDAEDDPKNIVQLQLSLTNHNNVFATETSSLYTQKRGGVGNKIKMETGEYIISSELVNSNDEMLLFSKSGNVFHAPISNLVLDCKTAVESMFKIAEWDKICAITATNKKNTNDYILFITKNGMIKKSAISEYNMGRHAALKSIMLDEGDEIVSVLFTNTARVGLLTEMGNFLMIETELIRPIGRVAKGVKAIKLNDGDSVISARVIPDNTTMIASISGNGLFKKTEMNEFTIQGRATKGSKIQKLTDDDWMADFYPITNNREIIVCSTRATIKLTVEDIPTLLKGAQGNKSIKLGAEDNVVGISIY